MIRRSIFLGLTVVLGAVLVYLILSSRREEKRVPDRTTEIVRASKLSATRVLSPSDIDVTGIRLEGAAPGKGEEASDGASMRCLVTVQNRGEVAYDRFMIRLVYRNPAGREESRSQVVEKQVPAMATVTLPAIAIGDSQSHKLRVEAEILWADLATEASFRPPQPATR